MSHRSRCLVVDYDHLQLARNKHPSFIVDESSIFVTHSLFLVKISKGIERRLRDGRGGDGGGGGGGGGGGSEVFGDGVFGGSVVFSGNGFGNGVRGVVCGVACGVVCGVVCDGVWGLSWSHRAEEKDSFVKYDMTGNDDFVGVQVKAPIFTMTVRVPKKDRWCGTRGKFVQWKGVRVTKASKCSKVGVRGWFVK
ncbi:hypothetical protein Tco_0566564 [Tanacetum coccineum]